MIIIKYFEWLRFLVEPERFPVWEIVDKEFEKIREIKPDEAKRLIKKHGLKLVHFNSNGAIYRND